MLSSMWTRVSRSGLSALLLVKLGQDSFWLSKQTDQNFSWKHRQHKTRRFFVLQKGHDPHLRITWDGRHIALSVFFFSAIFWTLAVRMSEKKKLMKYWDEYLHSRYFLSQKWQTCTSVWLSVVIEIHQATFLVRCQVKNRYLIPTKLVSLKNVRQMSLTVSWFII